MNPPLPTQEMESAPVMRVNAQSRTKKVSSSRAGIFKLDLRKFNPQPSSRTVNTPTSSPSVDHRRPVPQPSSFKFVTSTFQNGKEFITLPPPDPKPPPRKRQRKAGPREMKRFILSSRKPLSNADQVHRDIWKLILNFCEPKFLLEAKCIDSIRYDILTHHSAIWRRSRIRHFGDTIPPCPSALTEQQYVDLLVGRGCQISSCPQRHTTAVSWPLLGRICPSCLTQKTTTGDRLPPHKKHYVSEDMPLWDALPQGLSRPRWLNQQGTDWRGDERGSHFWKAAYDRLETEYLEKKSSGMPDAEIVTWWQARKNDTLKHHKEVEAIWLWTCRGRMPPDQNVMDSQWMRSVRAAFFEEKATALDPPMTPAELNSMTAYRKALRSSNAPSQRAWDILLEKMLPYRAATQEIVRITAESEQHATRMQYASVFHRLRDRRKGHASNEQRFVLELAQTEYEKCVGIGVTDHNMVLTCLRNVFDSYERIPVAQRVRGLCPDGQLGPYFLSMEDACMIVEQVISPETTSSPQQRLRTLESFRCPGCDTVTKFKFRQCLTHVYRKHTQSVGDEGEFWRLLRAPFAQFDDFPFSTSAWPRCLPMLPAYCEPSKVGPWSPDSHMTFIREEEKQRMPAFLGRKAVWKDETDPGFSEAFQRVVEVMQGVRIGSKHIVALGLRYASDLCVEGEKPTLKEFLEMFPAWEDINPALFITARCGKCAVGDDENTRKRPNKIEIPLQRLYKHWQERHERDGLDWMDNFILLPSEEDLLEEMQQTDDKLRKDKQKISEFKAETNEKKRQNLKATAILATPYAMAAFGDLYHEV